MRPPLQFRRIFLSAVAFFVCSASCFAQESPRIGLWVEVEGENRPFDTKEGFDRFREFTGKWQFTDLYCQVYRGGRSWFASVLADDRPYSEALSQGVDPLGDTIKMAHERGQRVHAWINLLRIIENSKAPLLQTLGPEAVLEDEYGNSLLNYDSEGKPPGEAGKVYKLGTPGIWLDPSSEALRRYLVNTIQDVLKKYPDIDGIHLDMVRYPMALVVQNGANSIDFGYGEATLTRFFEAKSPVSPLSVWRKKAKSPELSAKWDKWRRDQVTTLVREIGSMMRTLYPSKELSAAVIAWPDRAYGRAFQDWQGWISGGLLDAVLPMSYTNDSNVVWSHSQEALSAASRGKVLMGLGAWLALNNQERLIKETELALRSGADGIVLFSYSNLVSAKGERLVDELFTRVLTSLEDVEKNHLGER